MRLHGHDEARCGWLLLRERAGVVGAHAMVMESVYAPDAVDRQLAVAR